MIFVGWIIGGPIIGVISDRRSKRKPFLYASTLLTCLCILPVIYISELPVWLLFVLLLLVGFFQSAQLLNFSLSIELNAIEAKGTSIAITNFLVSFGTSMMQPLLGYLLDLGWDGRMEEGIPIYSIQDYHMAMVSFPATLLIAFILLLFLKEKGKTEKESFSEVLGMD